jgi:hypothetical protein
LEWIFSLGLKHLQMAQTFFRQKFHGEKVSIGGEEEKVFSSILRLKNFFSFVAVKWQNMTHWLSLESFSNRENICYISYISGLFYKHIIIINDASSVMFHNVASL